MLPVLPPQAPSETARDLPSNFEGPGLVDLQVNGYAGFDFNAPPEHWTIDALYRVRSALRRRGVVAALPTFITDDAERMVARAAVYAGFLAQDPELAETFPKLHIEGPFISPDEGPRGAHLAAYCRTPREIPDLLARIQEASGGRVGILTLAPELPGALDLIAEAARQGVCVALGHTQAGPDIIRQAVDAGAVLSTHLGNGSHQLLPKLENYVQAQLAEDRLFASFIADGHHIPWYTLKNFLRAKTREKSVLVSDAISAAEVGPGRYRVGEQEIEVSSDLRVNRPGQRNLAGSALSLDRAVIHVASYCGVAFEDAWAMASTTPAHLAGLRACPRILVSISESGFSALGVAEG